MSRQKKSSLKLKIEAVKNIIAEIYTDEKKQEIIKFLCQDVTYAFIFHREFELKETGDKEIPYSLTSEGKPFLLEDYKFNMDFVNNYTGSTEWDEGTSDFETYGDFFFANVLKSIDENISIKFNEQFGNDAYDLFKEEISTYEVVLNELQDLIRNVVTSIWTDFLKMEFKDSINKYAKFVMDEEIEAAKLKDTFLEKQSTNSFLYQEIVEEFEEEYDINLNSLTDINEANTDVIEALNEWAKEQTYEKIELMDAYLPTSKYVEYKWLDRKVYEMKLMEFQKVKEDIENYFVDMGVKIVDSKTSYYTDSLYRLLNEIFKISDEKIITLYCEGGSKTFFLDEYNRLLKINNFENNADVVEYYEKFLFELDLNVRNGGTLIVKNLLGKKTVKKGREVFDIYSYELRAAYLVQGTYRGLKKSEAEKFISMTPNERNQYNVVSWNMGNQNLNLKIVDKNDDIDFDGDSD